jgi:hypothetical protein
VAGLGWAGCGLPPTSPRDYHTTARGQSPTTRADSIDGCPRTTARSGYARSTGRHTTPSRKRPSLSRRHVEQPHQDSEHAKRSGRVQAVRRPVMSGHDRTQRARTSRSEQTQHPTTADPPSRSGKFGTSRPRPQPASCPHRERYGEAVRACCFTLMPDGQGDHPMIISILYLPETTVNVRYQCVLSRSVCAGQTNCSVIIGTVR